MRYKLIRISEEAHRLLKDIRRGKGLIMGEEASKILIDALAQPLNAKGKPRRQKNG